MAKWQEWKEFMEDEAFWYNYEHCKNTMPWKVFKETEWYKTASDFRRITSEWSRLALNSPTQGGLVPCINSLNSVKSEMIIPSQDI